MAFVVATFLFQNSLDPFQVRFGQMLDADEVVTRELHGAYQFVQLGLNG